MKCQIPIWSLGQFRIHTAIRRTSYTSTHWFILELNFLPAWSDLVENIIPDFPPLRSLWLVNITVIVPFPEVRSLLKTESSSIDAPDLTDESVEHVVHVSPVSSARLVERTIELLGQSLTLPHVHRPVGLLEVDLIGYQDHRNVLWGPDFSYKISVLHSLVETVPLGNII